jgi:hypothetical protein
MGSVVWIGPGIGVFMAAGAKYRIESLSNKSAQQRPIAAQDWQAA